MSESKYRALLTEALLALENVGLMEHHIDFDLVSKTTQKIEAALAEPPVQAELAALKANMLREQWNNRPHAWGDAVAQPPVDPLEWSRKHGIEEF